MAYRILGIDHGSKEDLVKECGAEVFLDITKFDSKTLAAEVKKATGGLGASAVVVCTAANGAYAQALDFLRFGGTLVCVGVPEGDHKTIANAFPGEIVSDLCYTKSQSTREAMQRDVLINYWRLLDKI
jgi:propanol-preferring alcohol dehydrogenase